MRISKIWNLKYYDAQTNEQTSEQPKLKEEFKEVFLMHIIIIYIIVNVSLLCSMLMSSMQNANSNLIMHFIKCGTLPLLCIVHPSYSENFETLNIFLIELSEMPPFMSVHLIHNFPIRTFYFCALNSFITLKRCNFNHTFERIHDPNLMINFHLYITYILLWYSFISRKCDSYRLRMEKNFQHYMLQYARRSNTI